MGKQPRPGVRCFGPEAGRKGTTSEIATEDVPHMQQAGPRRQRLGGQVKGERSGEAVQIGELRHALGRDADRRETTRRAFDAEGGRQVGIGREPGPA